ncbi:hypothetical protein F4802DRAFT_543624 [Xylaria palmicola]|nr:hypothetical protein F4802DRAFT_543624 [Xylaria palmicola]
MERIEQAGGGTADCSGMSRSDSQTKFRRTVPSFVGAMLHCPRDQSSPRAGCQTSRSHRANGSAASARHAFDNGMRAPSVQRWSFVNGRMVKLKKTRRNDGRAGVARLARAASTGQHLTQACASCASPATQSISRPRRHGRREAGISRPLQASRVDGGALLYKPIVKRTELGRIRTQCDIAGNEDQMRIIGSKHRGAMGESRAH